MTQTVVHRLVGYDTHTELAVWDQEITDDRLFEWLKQLVNVPETDPLAIESYPIDGVTFREIAWKLRVTPPSNASFFLEADA